MSLIKRVSADDLLDLIDRVEALKKRADQCSQGSIEAPLATLREPLYQAARSAALAEAQDRRSHARAMAAEKPGEGGT